MGVGRTAAIRRTIDFLERFGECFERHGARLADAVATTRYLEELKIFELLRDGKLTHADARRRRMFDEPQLQRDELDRLLAACAAAGPRARAIADELRQHVGPRAKAP